MSSRNVFSFCLQSPSYNEATVNASLESLQLGIENQPPTEDRNQSLIYVQILETVNMDVGIAFAEIESEIPSYDSGSIDDIEMFETIRYVCLSIPCTNVCVYHVCLSVCLFVQALGRGCLRATGGIAPCTDSDSCLLWSWALKSSLCGHVSHLGSQARQL